MDQLSSIEIGVDIGGTFTDVVCRQAGVPLRIIKIPSTPEDPSMAVLRSIELMMEAWGIRSEQIARFVHGTTVATNAVLERKGARIGILTTRGFKDTLEIGRQMRQTIYAVILDPETPGFLAPGALRKEVTERVSATGEEVIPLDEGSVLEAAGELANEGVEAVAICFLFSFLDPRHELRTRELIKEAHPDLITSVSCEVDPSFREYERTVVTAFDAYIKPVIGRYLERLEVGLSGARVSAPLQVMQSRGGIMTSAVARLRPVRLFLSGPAAGVVGGRLVGRAVGADNIITFDMGGTSCDISLISEGKPMIRPEGRVGGYPVRVSMVDVNAIGAGGGSIAWLDTAGGLRCGPHSAGSEPGPACYGRGGNDATITDASVVLGYLNPDYFAGGSVKLHADLAWRVIEENIAKPLGFSVEKAALGIHRVVNAQMTEGIRLVSINQGFDPRHFSLVPLGGAGPVHATALARDLNVGKIIVPRHPGVLSAVGLLAAHVEHEVSTAFPRTLEELSAAEVRTALDELDGRCAKLMEAEQVRSEDVTVLYFADICYVGQSHYLEIRLFMDEDVPLDRLYRDFLAAHDRVYGHSTDAPARIVNLRAIHQAGGLDSLDQDDFRPIDGDACKGFRDIMVAGMEGHVRAAVYDREFLAEGVEVDGPAIVEQADTTTLVEPGWHARVLPSGDLLITRN
jgi:N-methylhydantoinase A